MFLRFFDIRDHEAVQAGCRELGDHLEANKSIQEGRHLRLDSIVFVLSLTNTVAEVLEDSIRGQ